MTPSQPPNKQSETPRTDDYSFDCSVTRQMSDGLALKKLVDFALTLERELNEAKKLNGIAICVYCGQQMERNVDLILAHAKDCEHHPIQDIEKLQSQLAQVQKERDEALNNMRFPIDSLSPQDEAELRFQIRLLSKERDEFHRCLLAREESLKQSGDEWVKAKTELDEERQRTQQLENVVRELVEAINQLAHLSNNRITYFEESPSKNPECAKRWIGLNKSLTKAREVLGHGPEELYHLKAR